MTVIKIEIAIKEKTTTISAPIGKELMTSHQLLLAHIVPVSTAQRLKHTNWFEH